MQQDEKQIAKPCEMQDCNIQTKAFKLLEDFYLFDHSFEKHNEALHEMFIGFVRNNSERGILNEEYFENVVFFYTEIRRLLQETDQIFKENRQD